MGRQEKNRTVEAPPLYFNFQATKDLSKPTNSIKMRFDEFEAIRLSDKLDYDHNQASRIMGISRPTFTRLLNKGRKKMASFLIDGKPLTLQGGSTLFSKNVYCCKNCQRPFIWEQHSDPICPGCNEPDVIEAKAACGGRCSCCEEHSMNTLHN